MYFIKQLGFINRTSENVYASRLWASKSKYDVNGWELIEDEFNIKYKKEFIKKNEVKKILSASDLSSYTFCPASFVIAKTFLVQPNQKAVTGINFHNRNRLLRKYGLAKGEKVNERQLKWGDNLGSTQAFWDDLNTSTVIYLGHSEEGKQEYFYDKKRVFVSQPDYILSNRYNKNFIVEEKFILNQDRYYNDNRPPIFYENHKVQLASYIHGINNIDIEYGYLIYWIYEPNRQLGHNSSYTYIDNLEPFVVTGNFVIKINKSENWRLLLNNKFTKIKSLLSTGVEDFDTELLSINKCMKCAVASYCGHKTGRFNELEASYSDRYLDLQKSIIPKQNLLPDYESPY